MVIFIYYVIYSINMVPCLKNLWIRVLLILAVSVTPHFFSMHMNIYITVHNILNKLINTFIQQGDIKLFKIGSKGIYYVTKVK